MVSDRDVYRLNGGRKIRRHQEKSDGSLSLTAMILIVGIALVSLLLVIVGGVFLFLRHKLHADDRADSNWDGQELTRRSADVVRFLKKIRSVFPN